MKRSSELIKKGYKKYTENLFHFHNPTARSFIHRVKQFTSSPRALSKFGMLQYWTSSSCPAADI